MVVVIVVVVVVVVAAVVVVVVLAAAAVVVVAVVVVVVVVAYAAVVVVVLLLLPGYLYGVGGRLYGAMPRKTAPATTTTATYNYLQLTSCYMLPLVGGRVRYTVLTPTVSQQSCS